MRRENPDLASRLDSDGWRSKPRERIADEEKDDVGGLLAYLQNVLHLPMAFGRGKKRIILVATRNIDFDLTYDSRWDVILIDSIVNIVGIALHGGE